MTSQVVLCLLLQMSDDDSGRKRVNKDLQILWKLLNGIYHSYWRVVYRFSLGIQTHARDVVGIHPVIGG